VEVVVNEVRLRGRRAEVESARPREYPRWPLIVTFWVFSLLFGVGAALGSGWGFWLLLAWVLLATTAAMSQRVPAW
jgi:hypothetical protein